MSIPMTLNIVKSTPTSNISLGLWDKLIKWNKDDELKGNIPESSTYLLK